MARHRNIRNLDDDDINFYDEPYYSSVDDDYAISPNTAKRYIYNGSQISESLILSPITKTFEMDLDDFQPINPPNDSRNMFNEVFELDDDYGDAHMPQNTTQSINFNHSTTSTVTFNTPKSKETQNNKVSMGNNVVDELDFDVLCSLTSAEKAGKSRKMEVMSSASSSPSVRKPVQTSVSLRGNNSPFAANPLNCAMFVKPAKQNSFESKLTPRLNNKLAYLKPVAKSKLAQSIRRPEVQVTLNNHWLKKLTRSQDPIKRYYSISRQKVPKFFLFDVPEPLVYHVNPFSSSDMSRNYLRKLPMKREKAKKLSFKSVKKLPEPKTPAEKQKKVPPSKPEQASNTEAPTVQPAAEKIDRSPLIKMFKDSRENNYKPSLNLIVVGHVDAGKSTMMGNLLCQCGQVNSKQLAKFRWESQKIGKSSFAFAWVLDQTSQERERGITMDVSQSTLETEKKRIILLDAPGHRDFVPQVMSGAAQADFAILVVNASNGEFETGFEENGQTREHAILLRMFGVNRLIVAVNKMDSVDWSVKRFTDIQTRLTAFLKTFGMISIDFVPVSGLMGVNLTKDSHAWCKNRLAQTEESDIRKLAPWYEGPSLIGVVDDWPEIERNIEEPFRFVVSDIYKPTGSSTAAVCGRIISGGATGGVNIATSKVVCHPRNSPAVIKAIRSMCFSANTQASEIFDESTMMNNLLKAAFIGDQVALFLQNVDPYQSLASGDIISDPDNPVPTSNRIKCKLTVMKIAYPLLLGSPVIIHHLCNSFTAKISKIITTQERKGKNGQEPSNSKRPRFINSNSTAEIQLTFDIPRCVDTYDNCKPLGRFMIRIGDASVAGGIVTEVLKTRLPESNND